MKTKLLFALLLPQLFALKSIAQQGQALNFDYTLNTNISLANNIQLLDSFTIEAWINPDSKTDFSTIIGNKSPGIASPGYFLAINNYASSDGKIVFETQNATNSTVANVIWNQWQHIAITWNGAKVRIYINGAIQQLNDSTYMNLQPSSSPCFLGDIPAYVGNGNYHGIIDELRVWNYAKSQQAIQTDMFCQLSGTPQGLLAYYQFNEGISYGNNFGVNTLPDLSGNNNTGTLINYVLNGPDGNWLAPGGVSNITFSQNIASCEGSTIIVGSNTYTSDGIYFDTLSASNGCDSIVTTTVLFNPTNTVSQSFTICTGDSVVVGNSIYFNNGNFTDSFLNTNGCDSIVSTDITINVPNISVTQVGNTLNAEVGATSYQWIICDSVNSIIPNETNASFSPFVDGNYAVIVTLGNCTDQSACIPMVLTSINDTRKTTFDVYPNPAKDFILLQHTKQGDYFQITNLQGMLVKEGMIKSTSERIDISLLQSGMYFVRNNSGKHVSFIKE